MNQYYTIRQEDVGRDNLKLWGKEWLVYAFDDNGPTITLSSVGHRVYLVPDAKGGFLIKENNAVRRTRENNERRSKEIQRARRSITKLIT